MLECNNNRSNSWEELRSSCNSDNCSIKSMRDENNNNNNEVNISNISSSEDKSIETDIKSKKSDSIGNNVK